jgi:L-threonylcarbamoyladenylate synthase
VDLNKDYDDVIAEAVEVLNSGGVVIYPTDTLYGLGVNALEPEAVEKIFAVKGRDFSKPLPVIVKNMVWADELVYISPRNQEILKKVWPGKFTAVLPKKNIIPEMVNAGASTLGVRIPDFVFIDKLLGKFGYPLTATSANISGEEPTNDIDRIVEIFSEREIKPDLVIDAGVLPPAEPSIIVDLTTDKPKVLRVNPTTPQKLLELLKF